MSLPNNAMATYPVSSGRGHRAATVARAKTGSKKKKKKKTDKGKKEKQQTAGVMDSEVEAGLAEVRELVQSANGDGGGGAEVEVEGRIVRGRSDLKQVQFERLRLMMDVFCASEYPLLGIENVVDEYYDGSVRLTRGLDGEFDSCIEKHTVGSVVFPKFSGSGKMCCKITVKTEKKVDEADARGVVETVRKKARRVYRVTQHPLYQVHLTCVTKNNTDLSFEVEVECQNASGYDPGVIVEIAGNLVKMFSHCGVYGSRATFTKIPFGAERAMADMFKTLPRQFVVFVSGMFVGNPQKLVLPGKKPQALRVEHLAALRGGGWLVGEKTDGVHMLLIVRKQTRRAEQNVHAHLLLTEKNEYNKVRVGAVGTDAVFDGELLEGTGEFVVFDMLFSGEKDLRGLTFDKRRGCLEKYMKNYRKNYSGGKDYACGLLRLSMKEFVPVDGVREFDNAFLLTPDVVVAAVEEGKKDELVSDKSPRQDAVLYAPNKTLNELKPWQMAQVHKSDGLVFVCGRGKYGGSDLEDQTLKWKRPSQLTIDFEVDVDHKGDSFDARLQVPNLVKGRGNVTECVASVTLPKWLATSRPEAGAVETVIAECVVTSEGLQVVKWRPDKQHANYYQVGIDTLLARIEDITLEDMAGARDRGNVKCVGLFRLKSGTRSVKTKGGGVKKIPCFKTKYGRPVFDRKNDVRSIGDVCNFKYSPASGCMELVHEGENLGPCMNLGDLFSELVGVCRVLEKGEVADGVDISGQSSSSSSRPGKRGVDESVGGGTAVPPGTKTKRKKMMGSKNVTSKKGSKKRGVVPERGPREKEKTVPSTPLREKQSRPRDNNDKTPPEAPPRRKKGVHIGGDGADPPAPPLLGDDGGDGAGPLAPPLLGDDGEELPFMNADVLALQNLEAVMRSTGDLSRYRSLADYHLTASSDGDRWTDDHWYVVNKAAVIFASGPAVDVFPLWITTSRPRTVFVVATDVTPLDMNKFALFGIKRKININLISLASLGNMSTDVSVVGSVDVLSPRVAVSAMRKMSVLAGGRPVQMAHLPWISHTTPGAFGHQIGTVLRMREPSQEGTTIRVVQ